jgi:hypothetical protein
MLTFISKMFTGLSAPYQTTFDKSGHREPQMSSKFLACLRGQSAVISSDPRIAWRQFHNVRSNDRTDTTPCGRICRTRRTASLPTMSRKMMAPSRGTIVLHGSPVIVARPQCHQWLDPLAAVAGTSFVRPSPYITQASRPCPSRAVTV